MPIIFGRRSVGSFWIASTTQSRVLGQRRSRSRAKADSETEKKPLVPKRATPCPHGIAQGCDFVSRKISALTQSTRLIKSPVHIRTSCWLTGWELVEAQLIWQAIQPAASRPRRLGRNSDAMLSRKDAMERWFHSRPEDHKVTVWTVSEERWASRLCTAWEISARYRARKADGPSRHKAYGPHIEGLARLHRALCVLQSSSSVRRWRIYEPMQRSCAFPKHYDLSQR